MVLKGGRLAVTTARMGCIITKGIRDDNYKNLENLYNREGTASMMVNWEKDWER